MTTTMTTKDKLLSMDASFEQMKLAYSELRKQFLEHNYQAKSNYTIGVSAGHGGILESIYQTKGKRFTHVGEKMHLGSTFCEGVFNRVIADKFCARLKELKMVYKKFYHEYEDWPLKQKSDMVNHHHINIQPVLLFELHSNASKYHNANGFSVYTAPGQTQSDIMATKLWQEMNKIASKFGFSMRSETRNDGDVDYEARFWMCVKTACPTILVECLFFDYLKDANILMNENFQDAYVECLVFVATWADKNLPIK